ncbi:aquaporin-10 [Amia ocellicauda]|uniref:aquaporin-10 n=1 Tax=Amia ocellicauda TaxID=2972642 RepID=UPI003463C954
MDRARRLCRVRSQLLRECLAESLGTYIMILFGCGGVAQVTTSSETKGQYLSINLAFALGVTFAVYASRGVSGAHLNPAVSLSLCVLGKHQWKRLPFYVFFQLLGSFLAAATVYALYYEAIMEYSQGNLTVSGPRATAGIFATYPSDYLSIWSGFLDQVVGTAALLLCVLAVGDERNSAPPAGLEPVLVGLVVLGIGISMGGNCGYPLNPARDLGPRLFTFIAGWGGQVFTAGGGWWWVPLVAPLLGALTGTALYQLLVEFHHPPHELDPPGTQANEVGLALEVEREAGEEKGVRNGGEVGDERIINRL